VERGRVAHASNGGHTAGPGAPVATYSVLKERHRGRSGQTGIDVDGHAGSQRVDHARNGMDESRAPRFGGGLGCGLHGADYLDATASPAPGVAEVHRVSDRDRLGRLGSRGLGDELGSADCDRRLARPPWPELSVARSDRSYTETQNVRPLAAIASDTP